MQRMMSSVTLAMAAMLWLAGVCVAQLPEIPKPTKEHELLGPFAGEWEVAAEANVAPGVDPIKCTGTESSKMVGGFWLVAEMQMSTEGGPVNSTLTLGYNPTTKKYIGTFFTSVDSTL